MIDNRILFFRIVDKRQQRSSHCEPKNLERIANMTVYLVSISSR